MVENRWISKVVIGDLINLKDKSISLYGLPWKGWSSESKTG
jgi:hypothetical protein